MTTYKSAVIAFSKRVSPVQGFCANLLEPVVTKMIGKKQRRSPARFPDDMGFFTCVTSEIQQNKNRESRGMLRNLAGVWRPNTYWINENVISASDSPTADSWGEKRLSQLKQVNCKPGLTCTYPWSIHFCVHSIGNWIWVAGNFMCNPKDTQYQRLAKQSFFPKDLNF